MSDQTPHIDLDEILFKVGQEINKVYTGDPLRAWCTQHYFKQIEGVCVGCEAKAKIEALLEAKQTEARIRTVTDIARIAGERVGADPEYTFDAFAEDIAEYAARIAELRGKQ